jgi:hypothetical protein
MVEYKVVVIFGTRAESVESRLNVLAQDGWLVVCACGTESIIMERITDESALLAEEVLRRQFTYSLPGMEAQNAS